MTLECLVRLIAATIAAAVFTMPIHADREHAGRRCHTQDSGLAPEYWGPESSGCPMRGPCDEPDNRDEHRWSAGDPVKWIRLHFVVFRNNDGTNLAADEEDVRAQVAQLNADFRPYGIQFTWTSRYVSDSNYRIIAGESDIPEMKQLYARSPESQCNIFVSDFGPYDPLMLGEATFPWEPFVLTAHGGAMVDDDSFGAGQRTLTHELGHAFGLLHTFAGVDEVDEECDACWERADGVNGDTTGDFASDTPPTPENYSCTPPGGDDPCSGAPWGATQPENFMSYADDDCLSMFTPQQVARMHCWIEHSLSAYLCHVREEVVPQQTLQSGSYPVVSGELMMVGAESHAVRIYRYDGAGWATEQEISTPFTEGPETGFAIANDSEIAVISSSYDEAAVAYHRSGDDWIAATLPGGGGGSFGASCDTAAHVAIVSAPTHYNPWQTFGVVYVYRFDGSTWSIESELTGDDLTFNTYGFDVAIAEDGQTVVVGEPTQDTWRGAAYVFRDLGNGNWIQEAKLIAVDGEMQEKLGTSVAISGDVIVLGGQGADRAVVYRRVDGLWIEEQQLHPDPDDANADGFGRWVDISGETIIVGDTGVGTAQPYVFRFNGSFWEHSTTITGAERSRAAVSGNVLAAVDMSGESLRVTIGLEAGAVASCGCPADLGGDGSVGTADLLQLLGAWGGGPETGADIDGDGVVGVGDLLVLLAAWGSC